VLWGSAGVDPSPFWPLAFAGLLEEDLRTVAPSSSWPRRVPPREAARRQGDVPLVRRDGGSAARRRVVSPGTSPSSTLVAGGDEVELDVSGPRRARWSRYSRAVEAALGSALAGGRKGVDRGPTPPVPIRPLHVGDSGRRPARRVGGELALAGGPRAEYGNPGASGPGGGPSSAPAIRRPSSGAARACSSILEIGLLIWGIAHAGARRGSGAWGKRPPKARGAPAYFRRLRVS